MSYKLTVSDVLDVPVKITLADGGKTATHAFTVRAKRMSQEALRDALQDSARPTKDLLTEQVVGWRGQRLVVGENDEPAEFNAESFDFLLSLAGMEQIMLSSYLRSVVLADTGAEKAKN